MTEPEMIESLRVHRFEPGDRLVLKTRDALSPSMGEHLRDTLRRWSGIPLESVLVLDEGVELEVVRGLPPEGESP